MATNDIITPLETTTGALPVVQKITIADVWSALHDGVDDFRAMPTHVIFLSLIYPVAGALLVRAAMGYELLPLLYPIVAGFALVGPFAAIGLYELSRRREQGLDVTWSHAFDVARSPSLWPILALGAILVAIFCIWVAIAHALYTSAFGEATPASLQSFLAGVFTTPQGWWLMFTGNMAGIALSIVVFAISVVAFPLLLDRNVGFATAILTSLRAVALNPTAMTAWGLVVAAGLVFGALPLLCGLAIVLPVLGHTTWHLYRRLVKPEDGTRPAYVPKDKGRRFAAEFPASLFTRSRHSDR